MKQAAIFWSTCVIAALSIGHAASGAPDRSNQMMEAAGKLPETMSGTPVTDMTSPHMAMAAPPATTLLPAPVLPPEPVASADEPMARALSGVRAAAYLDTIAVNWTKQRQCGTCHTNYAYMMARPALGNDKGHEAEVRGFFDTRVRERTSKPGLPHTLILAAMLSINDAQHGGALRPGTREALDQAWEMQDEDGAWTYPVIFYSPPLGDPWYGAAMVALGTGLAGEAYARTPAAIAGMTKLRGWLARHPAPSLHHRLVLLWASQRTPGLMTPTERRETIRSILALQHPDGGWSLPALGDWNRRDGSPNDPNTPSDGYATGFVAYVLQEAGLSPGASPVAGALSWLRTHQRASGRWFTPSINTYDKGNLISNVGTAYAVMALHKGGDI